MESARVSLQGSSRRMTSGRRSALLVVDREQLHNPSAFVGFDVAARHEALSREDGQAVVAELDLPRDVLPAPSRLSREARAPGLRRLRAIGAGSANAATRDDVAQPEKGPSGLGTLLHRALSLTRKPI